MRESLAKIKAKSKRLMHFLFPLTIIIMLSTRWLYPRMFNPDFQKSADIFLVYSLLIIPRLVFPQTIIVGRKKTHISLIAAVLELTINISLSFFMISKGYNLVGVAFATFIAYLFGKVFLISYCWSKMKIKPYEYIPVKLYLLYSTIVTLVFVLIDHRIIDIQ
jgi:O-antigen/teichoic acid export membrane protein